ncbi:MAG: hypothetical protein AB3N17_10550, partial [Tateyamaria sp.]
PHNDRGRIYCVPCRARYVSPMRTWLVLALVILIVIAHIFLWRSDMPMHLKLTFTIINATGWTIVLAPILLIDRWLDAIQRRNRDDHDNVT